MFSNRVISTKHIQEINNDNNIKTLKTSRNVNQF